MMTFTYKINVLRNAYESTRGAEEHERPFKNFQTIWYVAKIGKSLCYDTSICLYGVIYNIEK